MLRSFLIKNVFVYAILFFGLLNERIKIFWYVYVLVMIFHASLGFPPAIV